MSDWKWETESFLPKSELPPGLQIIATSTGRSPNCTSIPFGEVQFRSKDRKWPKPDDPWTHCQTVLLELNVSLTLPIQTLTASRHWGKILTSSWVQEAEMYTWLSFVYMCFLTPGRLMFPVALFRSEIKGENIQDESIKLGASCKLGSFKLDVFPPQYQLETAIEKGGESCNIKSATPNLLSWARRISWLKVLKAAESQEGVG